MNVTESPGGSAEVHLFEPMSTIWIPRERPIPTFFYYAESSVSALSSSSSISLVSVRSVTMCMVTPIAMTTKSTLNHRISTKKTTVDPITTHRNTIDTIFDRIDTALYAKYPRIYRPNSLCRVSHRYKRLELFKKQSAERSKKGVVGRIGTKIPMTPRVSVAMPAVINNTFFIIGGHSIDDFSIRVFVVEHYRRAGSPVHMFPQLYTFFGRRLPGLC